jgi:hypothetical protein
MARAQQAAIEYDLWITQSTSNGWMQATLILQYEFAWITARFSRTLQ